MVLRNSVATSDGRSTPTTPSSEAASSANSDGAIVDIDLHGGIVIRFEHTIDKTQLSSSFRLSSTALKAKSKYFERLLQSGRFSEAAEVDAKHKLLLERYKSLKDAPSEELPSLHVEELGRISVKSIGPLLTDFLSIVHGKDVQANPPVGNLANLAIIADRFDALDAVRTYVRRKKLIRAIDGKTSAKAESILSEEKVRQRLLVALLLDDPSWAEKYSLRLITKGWVGKEASTSAPLWWDLPLRVEEELQYRRECILETIQSLQSYFLNLYSLRERQCKLGYDSSPQCDSFQLGEMMRFFHRVGTLQLQGTIITSDNDRSIYDGDILTLLDTLRQVPEYQIDRFHTHCGIRTRLIPLLDFLQKCIAQAGVCSECWQERRAEYAWIGAKRPLLWKRAILRPGSIGHGDRHASIRDLFTATEHDWS